MININFWNIVKNKWILDEDPTVAATQGLIQSSGQSKQEIDDLNKFLNGNMMNFDAPDSIDSINTVMEQLNDLGIGDDPFEDLFSDLGEIE